MRRILLLLGAMVLVAILVLPQYFYPVQVTFKFNYDNNPFEISYVALMRVGLCYELELCWDPGRRKIATPLPDGGLLILAAEWPFRWQKFHSGIEYPTQGRWMWLNKSKAPTQIVYADGAARLSPDRLGRPAFTWIVVSAKIERISELSLIQALLADSQPDGSDSVLNSQTFGGPIVGTGHLFGGIEVAPVHGDHLADISKLAEWTNLPNGCRVLPRRIGIKISGDTGGVVAEGAASRLLLRHDDLWSDRDAARPGEAFVLYPAGKPEPSGKIGLLTVPYYVRSILQQVHEFEFNGKKCVGINLPTDSYGAYVDMGDGAVLGLYPSLGFAVLRD